MVDWARPRVHHLNMAIRNDQRELREDAYLQSLEYANDRIEGFETRSQDCINSHWRHCDVWIWLPQRVIVEDIDIWYLLFLQ